MDRRAGGIAMLILVLLAAAVVPHIATRAIPGNPFAAPVPGPPAVGSCVTSVPPAGIFADAGSKYLVLPPMQYGGCAPDHYGEVTAVLQDVPLQRNPSAGVSTGPGYELWNLCAPAGPEYMGLADPSPGNAADPAAWVAALNASFVFAGPDARQRAAGQRWGACVLTAAPIIYDEPVRYAGSVRGTLDDARPPAIFGACVADMSVTATAESCADWHSFQILAQADLTTSSASPATRLADCAKVALRVTRMPDPTAGGRLRLTVRVDRYDADGTPSRSTGPLREGETQYGTCAVGTNGAQKLRGSVFGLGSDPVPLG